MQAYLRLLPRPISLTLLGCLMMAVPAPTRGEEPRLELRRGDRICLIGNTLADRMQHHGWLETLIQHRFSGQELAFRNLGFAADEVSTRPRSQNFGSPDKHLAHSRADVVLAFFGYNESFAGKEGLDGFKAQLGQMLEQMGKQQYNGTSAPRIVLLSPIAHEDLHDPNLPDGKDNNARLEMYTNAMAEVARARGAVFVDLFHPTQKLYAAGKGPLTINGIHLTAEGNRRLAEVIDQALFGAPPSRTEPQLEKVRQAVLDKNLHWHNRYRATDGYNIYGGRSQTGNYDGQTNFTITQREMEILDVMTANRDRRIWAVARGGDLKVDDSNAPKPLKIATNRPGKNPDGSHEFLSGEAAIGQMTVHKGMKVSLFASEEKFPELINPVQASVDPDGRLWVAAWPTYPHWNPTEPLNDKLLILPDEDGDGKADRCITFADGLHNPTGFEFWGGGVLLAQAPDILFLKDTDGDDRADVRLRILHGIDSADTHHTANSFVIGPDGCLYFQRGIFHVTGIESPWDRPFRSTASGVYRYDPRGHRTEFHFAVGPNPHGDVFDRWGNQFVSDGTSGTGYHVAFPGRKAPKQLYVKQYRPVPGTGLIAGSHFPPALNGNLLIANAIGFQGVAQYRFVDQGAGFHAEPVEPILSSKDPNFRPTAVRIGGDGALYITDWQNPLIGHLQHNLRDPNRDHRHGRVYRVVAEGRPLRKPAKMAGKPVPEVVRHMLSAEDDVRYRARLELSGRDGKEVVRAAAALAAELDAGKPGHAQALVEALWLHQEHRTVNEGLLRKVLQSPEPNARAAATRMLRSWHDRVSQPGALLAKLAGDEHPRVRAEAVIAATYYQGADAPEVIFAAEQLPQDEHLRFVLGEARSSIKVDQYIKEALAGKKPLSTAAQLYVLRNASAADLVKLEPTEAVYLAILSRSGASAGHLAYALKGLAGLRKTDELGLLLKLIAEQDAKEEGQAGGAGELLMRQPAASLRPVRDRLERLAREGKTAGVRRLGYAGWVRADGASGDALVAALQNADRLRDFLEGIALIPEESIRRGLFAQVRSLLHELPPELAAGQGPGTDGQPGLQVDYFLPNPSNVALETLAKLRPTASGIAPEISLALPLISKRDAFALRFTGMIQIDAAGRYTFYLTSDDGSRLYLGSEEVINHDGLHGPTEKQGTIQLSAGLHPIVVTYYDNGGGDGLALAWSGPGIKKSPVPGVKLSTGGGETLQDVAVKALASIPGHEQEKVQDLAALVRAGRSRAAAIRVLRGIAREHWPKKEVRPLVDSLIAYLSQVPARYRTGPAAGDAMALARALAAALPEEQRGAVETRLANLDVRVIAIGTVPHRMIYDVSKIAVEAGKPVELRLSNIDSMPHNLAITLPGAMEEIGTLAEMTAQAPDVVARHYIPRSDKILLASKLLQPGDSQTLSFEAPKTPGVYPFVCTYPGHWRRMHGAIYVVASLKDYEADPQAYLASHPLPVKDRLLELLGKSHEWKLPELEGFVQPLEGGRSFEVGENAFKVASCVSCHRMGQEGQQIGPELPKLDAMKQRPEHILRSLINPSEQIEDRYRSYVFQLSSGKVITGMILEETPDTVTVVDNPLARTKPLVLRKDDIEARQQSPKSIMPEGLLSKLTREEILDLIAYVHARGDKKHPLFGAHHGH